MLIIGLWLSLGLWVGESLLDAYIFYHEQLSDHLFPANPHQLWMRCLSAAIIIGFSAYAERIIHSRQEAETALHESEDKYQELVENANSVVMRMSSGGEITYMNKFGLDFFGYSEDELVGQNTIGWIVPNTDLSGRNLAAMIEDIGANPERYINNENENMRRDGSRVWISWTNKAICNDSGEIRELLCIGNDITERKQAEDDLGLALQKVQEMSLIDQLTGLKNRRGFMTLASQQVKIAERTQEGLHLVFVDLDGLKWINDNLGHNVGDQAIIEAADVLRETFRDSDIIARLGGDEFAVLAIDVSPNVPFSTYRVAKTLKEHNSRENRRYNLEMSAGVASYDPKSCSSIVALLKRADELMYREKRRRRKTRGAAIPEKSERPTELPETSSQLII